MAKATKTEHEVPNGLYTVVRGTTHLTISISDWKDQQIVKVMVGSDNTNHRDWPGFATLRGREGRIWSRYASQSNLLLALRTVIADPATAGEAYAIESQKCWHCNRDLTQPASIARGLGPDCAKQLGAVLGTPTTRMTTGPAPLDAGEQALAERDAAFEDAQSVWAALTPQARAFWEQQAYERAEAHFDALIRQGEIEEDRRVAAQKSLRDIPRAQEEGFCDRHGEFYQACGSCAAEVITWAAGRGIQLAA